MPRIDIFLWTAFFLGLPACYFTTTPALVTALMLIVRKGLSEIQRQENAKLEYGKKVVGEELANAVADLRQEMNALNLRAGLRSKG